MEVIKTEIDGVVIIEPRIFKDARGYFFESYSQREFEEKVGKIDFCQDNEKHVILWRNARSALSAPTLYTKQACALRQGQGA